MLQDASSSDSDPTLGESPSAMKKNIKDLEGTSGLDTDIKSRDKVNNRDMILIKCKQAIENLHFELDKQKDENEVLLQ